MTLKDIAKKLTTSIQTIPELVRILAEGLENAEAGSQIEVTAIQESGTKIATITIDEEATDIYAPTSEVIYSTTERKIGKWIDGSDLYQKVIEYTPESSITTGDHAIADITGLKIIKYNAAAYNSTSGKSFNIPVSFGNTTTAIGTSGNDLILTLTNETWGTDSTFIVIIEYIKITE